MAKKRVKPEGQWGVPFKTKTGKDITLLNPQEKRTKFYNERLNNCHFTNDKKCKVDKNGQPIPLTDKQVAYRVGYEAAIKEQNKLYRATHKNYVSKHPENIKK